MMDEPRNTPLVEELMIDFARRTGLEPIKDEPVRYLWTDAFAVCNFLELHRASGEARHLQLALRLVEQVHDVLGRHRRDDPRRGWISGLDEGEGVDHPTAGGLRIGKRLPERARKEVPDPYLEWEQDGQYYHYLTKWMHALSRVSAVTGEPRYLRWAMELARASHSGFVHDLPGRRRMFWKMSIDLSYPLVPSMGQHDPLDGYITYRELQHVAGKYKTISLPDLEREVAEMRDLCRGGNWATSDPLGAGSLLIDAWRAVQMLDGDLLGLLEEVLPAAATNMRLVEIGGEMRSLPQARLAFRELGLSIGLRATQRMTVWLAESTRAGEVGRLSELFDGLPAYTPLADGIERTWSDRHNRGTAMWKEHLDINDVMLATSLAPPTFITL